MKPPRFTDDILAARHSSLAVVASRLAKIRGIGGDPEDGAALTNSEPEPSGGEVRVIPIRGIIARDVRGWFPWATDTEEIEALLDQAEGDANVTAIVLDIDSPGGTVNGVIELAEMVEAIDKPVVTYVSGMCASAAYWVASSTEILIRKSAEVGSIGVYSAVLDLSAYYAQMGVSVEMFSAGTHKGAGYPGTTLTDAQRAMIQGEVDSLAFEFKDFVSTKRPLELADMEGQRFMGEAAIERGLADGIVGGIQDAIMVAHNTAKAQQNEGQIEEQ